VEVTLTKRQGREWCGAGARQASAMISSMSAGSTGAFVNLRTERRKEMAWETGLSMALRQSPGDTQPRQQAVRRRLRRVFEQALEVGGLVDVVGEGIVADDGVLDLRAAASRLWSWKDCSPKRKG
jgi:hypothetical protein